MCSYVPMYMLRALHIPVALLIIYRFYWAVKLAREPFFTKVPIEMSVCM